MNNYINYAKALKQVISSRNNFKTAIFEHFKDNQNQLKQAYGIIIKTCKYFEQFKQIAEQLIKKKNADIQNVYLFAIYCTEQFLSDKKKIKGGGKLKKIITDNKEYIQNRLKIDESSLKGDDINGLPDTGNNQQQYRIKTSIYIRLIEGKISYDQFIQQFLPETIQTTNQIEEEKKDGSEIMQNQKKTNTDSETNINNSQVPLQQTIEKTELANDKNENQMQEEEQNHQQKQLQQDNQQNQEIQNQGNQNEQIQNQENKNQENSENKNLEKEKSEIQKIEQDKNIKNLLKVPHQIYQQLTKQSGFFNNENFIIQSKSSAFPAYILMQYFDNKLYKNLLQKNKNQVFDIIDSCAAPGNKTIQLAEYLKGRGKVYAFEKNPKRYELLQKRVKQYGFEKDIICLNQDFLEVNVNDPVYKNVQMVLMDPTCSGSGMLNHIYFDQNKKKEKKDDNAEKIEEEITTQKQFARKCKQIFNSLSDREKERLTQLKTFQLQILNKGLSFPNVKAISYSTCSIHETENEQVVKNLLENHKKLKLQHIMPEWQTRGFSSHELLESGDKCLRVNPFANKETDGFFVAIFTVQK